jgi:hypothetical protein
MYIPTEGYFAPAINERPRKVCMPRARPAGSAHAWNDLTFETLDKPADIPVSTVDRPASTYSDLQFFPSADTELLVFGGSAFSERASFEEMQSVLSSRDSVLNGALNELNEMFVEDYEHSLDPASVNGLRLFLLAHSWTSLPSLSAEPDGRIVATWVHQAQSTSLKFLDNDQFIYAMALETNKGKNRPWGTSSRFQFLLERPEARAILGPGSNTVSLEDFPS